MYIYLFFASHQSNVRGFMPMPYNSLIKFFKNPYGKNELEKYFRHQGS